MKKNLMQEFSLCATQNFINADIINKKANQYYLEMKNENTKDSKYVKVHTEERIFPAIAYYKAISESIGNKEKAYAFVHTQFEKEAKVNHKKLCLKLKFPHVYKLVPRIMHRLIHKSFGEKAGFKMIDAFYTHDKCHIDMFVCPYFENCKKYECKELTTVFCDSDDVDYDRMHKKLLWKRDGTLGRGNECCDFNIEIKQ